MAGDKQFGMLSKMEYMSIRQYTAKEWEGISGAFEGS